MGKLTHGAILALLLASSPAVEAWAQTAGATTAAIDGAVKDSTGAALPGVTVTATSPALQGAQTVVTNEEGVYRIPALPPGLYRIAYEMPGFASVVREGQRLAVGFNATINVALQVSTVQETVTVEGASPVVDQRASKLVANFDAEKLAAMPNSRDLWSILAVSPAVQVQRFDVGGSTAGTQTGYSVYDTKADQHRPTVEGMVMTEGTGAAGFYYDYGSFAEVSVGTGSHGADMGWPGVVTAFVAKSGGNSYSGRFYLDYQNEGIQATNIDEDQIARGLGARAGGGLGPTDLNRLSRYYDVNADLGGFVKRDRLWFYTSFRNQQIDVRYPNYPVDIFVTKLHNISGKGTYTLSRNNKLIGYTQWGLKQQPTRLDTFLIGSSAAIHTSPDSTWNQRYWGGVTKLEWNSVLSSKAYLELRGGRFGYDWPNRRNAEAPSIQDIGNNQVFGANRNWQQDIRRDQVIGALSYFQDGWAGSHNFKVGGEVFRETIDYIRGRPGESDATTFPGDVLQVLRNGTPIEVYHFASGTTSENGLWTTALYLNDTWQVNDRTTVNAGLRYERYQSFLPAQERPASRFFPDVISFDAVDDVMTWNLLSPRLGVNFDLTGSGKTLLKANYSQYWWNPGTGLGVNVNNNSSDWYRRYAWTDANGSGLWEPGEEGRLLASQGGAGSATIDPNLKDTYTREVAGWLEHELMSNFGIRTGVVYRRIGNLYQRNNANRPFSAYDVPVTIQDPGPDGRAGTADDGGTFQGYNLNAAALALPTVGLVENVPGESEFYTFEISGTRRMSGRWSLMTAYSYRWNDDHSTGYFGNSLRALESPSNPNDLVNTDEGRYNFSTWAYKLSGTYDAPFGVRIAPTFRYQAGQPFGRTFVATLNYGSQRILAEPIDTQSQDAIALVDVRLEKSISLGRGQMLSGVLDIYNMANSNAEQNINWSSGSTYLNPSNIVGPRIVRFGIRFDW